MNDLHLTVFRQVFHHPGNGITCVFCKMQCTGSSVKLSGLALCGETVNNSVNALTFSNLNIRSSFYPQATALPVTIGFVTGRNHYCGTGLLKKR